MMNLAVAGLIIPSTSARKTGAFSGEAAGVVKERREMKRVRAKIYRFKILSSLNVKYIKKRKLSNDSLEILEKSRVLCHRESVRSFLEFS
jgi:hypothetical protein